MDIGTVTHYLLHGLVAPTLLFLIFYTLITYWVSLLAVSCYLHRSQTHRAIFFIAPLNLIFRTIIWLLTGTVVREWVSIHRKHHQKCDTAEDPHSPRYFGLKKILLEGADMYHKLAKNSPELLREYGEGTPDDWLERTLFSRPYLGIGLSLVLQLVLFGIPALAIWSAQMLIQPVIAAGFINGITHVFGYQRYTDGSIDKDGRIFERIGDARNVPTYIIAFGEEFHNNHHAYQDRYKFSHAWYEFDVAGTLIEILTWVGFAWVPQKVSSGRHRI